MPKINAAFYKSNSRHFFLPNLSQKTIGTADDEATNTNTNLGFSGNNVSEIIRKRPAELDSNDAGAPSPKRSSLTGTASTSQRMEDECPFEDYERLRNSITYCIRDNLSSLMSSDRIIDTNEVASLSENCSEGITDLIQGYFPC